MGDVREYRSATTIRAERVDSAQNVNTSVGVQHAHQGDYLVYGVGGITLWGAEAFHAEYVELEGDSEFVPAGKTVDEVIDFMRGNPDQVDRVKKLESDGGERKGILNFK